MSQGIPLLNYPNAAAVHKAGGSKALQEGGGDVYIWYMSRHLRRSNDANACFMDGS